MGGCTAGLFHRTTTRKAGFRGRFIPLGFDPKPYQRGIPYRPAFPIRTSRRPRDASNGPDHPRTPALFRTFVAFAEDATHDTCRPFIALHL
ncbi:hypothetical protein GLE_5479 [Lysobacter enzymogenes]|uniref:Uncharacterized protein n=1 Tax=Lysobacter enzymogenes TaxID=69 RepID=A0A0S2DQD0_LYSEN|nr:hypothetical protein GLE_5479 [Lysobacter enzymogenes]